MKIRKLVESLDYHLNSVSGSRITDQAVIDCLLEREISVITDASRKVVPGCLFFCIKGAVFDGHDFAAGALENGACAIVVQSDLDLSGVVGVKAGGEASGSPEGADGNSESGSGSPEGAGGNSESGSGSLEGADGNSESGSGSPEGADVKTESGSGSPEGAGWDDRKGPVIIRVEDSRIAMAVISAAFYNNPAREMKTIGVTGTKGKTTTTYMIRSILEAAGIRTGLVGTIETLYETKDGEVRIPAANTTPESIEIQKTFRDMADSGVQAVVMEVSSQALKLHRTAGFVFDLGIFTNLSPDHIGPNEHTDFEDYLQCKSRLFSMCRVGIVNGDDPYSDRILEGHTCEVESYGLGEKNDLRAENISLIHTPGELGVEFDTAGVVSIHAHVPAPGRFSVYNALCAIAVCRHFKVSEDDICGALRKIHVKGRIEMVRVSDDFTLMIDYAHNAMALESLLKTLREYDTGRLVCLFGCGGQRARSRRFQMGEVSGRLADLTIVTSDNPRNEEPGAIIEDIVTGLKPTGGAYVTIPDRKDAIRYAIRNGQPGDIIVLAGKGHEDYQEIKGKKYPMDERVLIREILSEDN